MKDFDSYATAVLVAAQKMEPRYTTFCVDTIPDSYMQNEPIFTAAEAVVMETSYWSGDYLVH